MIQQVNLYQDRLKQGQKKPVINQYIYGLIAIIILILGFSIFLLLEKQATKSTLELKKQQLTETEAQLLLLQSQYPKQQINSLLSQEIVHTQNTVDSLLQVISLISDKSSDQTQGFSKYFSALARQSISEVWLRKIMIDGQNKQLSLHGSTFNPDKIPVMLQKLHDESIFQGKIFAKLIMNQADHNENQIDFIVSTRTELIEQKDHD